jgi:membrane fusion protein (multidrug efflux system)
MVETTVEDPKNIPPENEKHAPKHLTPEQKSARRKRKRIMTALAIFFLIIAILYLCYWLIWGRFEEYTDDAYVNGNVVRLMPQISGTITAIYTDDTQYVEQGQPVLKLDDSDMLIALQRTEASLGQTVRSVRALFDNVQQAAQMVSLRHAELEQASLDLKRRAGLVGEKAISREEMQHYLTSFEGAEAQYNYAKSQYNSALAQIDNTSLYQHPKVLRAKVDLRNAYLNYQRTTILAPVSGYVAKRSAQVGQQVTPGTSLLAIVPLNQIWVDANYKETQLGHLRIGQPVSVTVDALDGREFHGRILGLSPGTGSAFDLLPPQNATGNWIKIVQRLPVKIVLEQQEIRDHPLQIGLSVRTTSNTHKRNGSILDKTVSSAPIFITDVYSKQLANVDVMITTIITQNSPDISLPNYKPLAY